MKEGRRTRVVLVPEALCPLQELQVVLHLAFDQHLDRDGTVDVVLAESIAENLEVVQIGIVGGCVKLDTRHRQVNWRVDRQLSQGEKGTWGECIRKMLS